jgi:multiple sugar transport system permease protein
MPTRAPWIIVIAGLGPVLAAMLLLRIWPAALAVHDSLIAPRAVTYSLENYRYLFSDPAFVKSIWVTLVYCLIVNPLQIVVALGLALMVNAQLPMVGLWRTLIFLPVAVPQSVSAVVWGIAYRPDGPLNAALSTIGISPQPFLTSPDQAMAAIILLVSWIGVGYWMTFLLAGLQDIPRNLYDAALVDGASRWQQFIYITLPQLRRPLTFVLVANTVANFLVFAPVKILTQGGPRGSTNLIMNDIYTRAFAAGDPSSASAATVVLMATLVLIVSIQFRLMKSPKGASDGA